ncbi:MAG: pyruvate kinase [Balneolaceae bacterium]
MKIRSEKIQPLIKDIEEVISILVEAEVEHTKKLELVHPSFKDGAKNLIHYRAFRSLDLKKLQKRLSNYGLSILASTESHVMATLTNSLQILKSLIQESSKLSNPKKTSIKSSMGQQKKHAKDLFGYRSKGRRVRIMVTLPTEAAFNYQLVYDLVASGMNTARINCAHDDPKVWGLMIQNLNKAKGELHKNCKVFMDLAGPKIRTSALKAGLKVRKFKPKRNELGKVIQPAIIELVSELNHHSNNELPVDQDWLKSLREGDSIEFKDTREKRRKLFVKSALEYRVMTTCRKTCFIETGTLLKSISTLEESLVGELPSKEQSILLKKGDYLKLLKDQVRGKSSLIDMQNENTDIAHISCTSPEIFNSVKTGEKVLFDDGKITGVVREFSESEICIEILQVKLNGSKLKADKGINFPETDLDLGGLTSKDQEDLAFIVQNADGVNVSFINSTDDISELYSELENLGASDDFGVVLKVENQKAYKNLIEILINGMQRYPIGVMIARGDLAIEAGWEKHAPNSK